MKPKELSVEDAIKFMQDTLRRMEEAPRGELTGIDADTAFEMGYKVALADLEACTRKVDK